VTINYPLEIAKSQRLYKKIAPVPGHLLVMEIFKPEQRDIAAFILAYFLFLVYRKKLKTPSISKI
jgi:hypothetical protein